MATLEEHLNTLSLKQIKNLVREHNLLSKIKLGQPKEVLIARLLEHFEELVDGDMVSSIYKIKVPKETDVVPKKGQKRIALERPVITQQEINPGEAVLRQMIEPKRKTGTLVSNNDKGLQEAVRIPEEAKVVSKKKDTSYITAHPKFNEGVELTKKAISEDMKTKEGRKMLSDMDKEFNDMLKAQKTQSKAEPEKAEPEKAEPEKAEPDEDETSMKLQKLLMLTPMKDIIKVLVKLNFKGRLQSNKILAITQILQNFNTIQKMEKLIEALSITGKGKLGRDGHGQRKILHGEEIHGEGEHWERFKKIGIPILATAAAVGAAYAGHRAYQNNNRIVTYKGYNPDSHWTPGSYREVLRSEPRSLARIDSGLPNPPSIRYPPTAPPLPPPLTVIPYTRSLTRQPRIDLKAVLKAQKTGNVSGLTRFQLERYARLNK